MLTVLRCEIYKCNKGNPCDISLIFCMVCVLQKDWCIYLKKRFLVDFYKVLFSEGF